MAIKITGSGSYIPTQTVTNTDFERHQFLNEDGSTYAVPNEVIAEKFKDITGIEERRYVEDDLTTSDIAFFAAEKAIEDSKIDPEKLDYIIVAHNFGDVKKGAIQSDTVPSIAARVKHKLRIRNPKCVGYDVMFGCPGWIEGMIQAQAFIKAGMAKKCLVIGAETLSRVVDMHDRDSMIYSDGAGATVLELTDGEGGFLAHETASFTYEESKFLFFGKSYNVDHNPDVRYLKMYGRKIYEFALTNVPLAMKACLDNSGIPIADLTKILIHQANEKMDEAIVHRFFKLYQQTPPENVMPMNIKKLGNSSVATIPTLYDLILKGKIENQELHKGDVVLFASVGAGMNINAFVYRC
ncbi:3-oxoacyl-ACP synthase [Flavobacterium saliperosum S13]|uniref:3-oxoacyl-[acyl-carrier-protein] synthase-3 n=2 Tax=Flavobacterium saliperosum TaxID=329186 RepID=A0A1G4VPC9_9FLAO|nr:ketoacyl-ACP synthase III [Flavobacterium saliperosum]ESU23626.1 3-oxoacyl-ACP synthase [Flavobacterium saliperosum S13]SCX09139.1 3-oxoacyl-[acyl-carrier-protein] synthase-3 [Flavobacterium saliperosum]